MHRHGDEVDGLEAHRKDLHALAVENAGRKSPLPKGHSESREPADKDNTWRIKGVSLKSSTSEGIGTSAAKREAGIPKERELPLPYEVRHTDKSEVVGTGRQTADHSRSIEKEGEKEGSKRNKDIKDSWGQSESREQHGVNLISNEMGPKTYTPPPPTSPTTQSANTHKQHIDMNTPWLVYSRNRRCKRQDKENTIDTTKKKSPENNTCR